MIPPHRFASAAIDELWLDGRRLERRVSHGRADFSAGVIRASDAPDDELLALATVALDELRAAAPRDARVRLAANARRAADAISSEAVMIITRDGRSVVTDASHAAEDDSRLSASSPLPARRGEGGRRPGEGRPSHAALATLPMLWRNGSAAVLLHEAAGHPAEHHHPPVEWPTWLTVHDEPAAVADDTGSPTRAADLLAGESPRSYRRESFRDVPLRRMSSLVARQQGAPFELPPSRIEIDLLSGGHYEPLTGEVSLFVVASTLVEEGKREPLPPFRIQRPRESIAASLTGAAGEPRRYPGVICSSEGQELFVASAAPDLLTRFR